SPPSPGGGKSGSNRVAAFAAGTVIRATNVPTRSLPAVPPPGGRGRGGAASRVEGRGRKGLPRPPAFHRFEHSRRHAARDGGCIIWHTSGPLSASSLRVVAISALPRAPASAAAGRNGPCAGGPTS